jgi:hypothetical protein
VANAQFSEINMHTVVNCLELNSDVHEVCHHPLTNARRRARKRSHKGTPIIRARVRRHVGPPA